MDCVAATTNFGSVRQSAFGAGLRSGFRSNAWETRYRAATAKAKLQAIVEIAACQFNSGGIGIGIGIGIEAR